MSSILDPNKQYMGSDVLVVIQEICTMQKDMLDVAKEQRSTAEDKVVELTADKKKADRRVDELSQEVAMLQTLLREERKVSADLRSKYETAPPDKPADGAEPPQLPH